MAPCLTPSWKLPTLEGDALNPTPSKETDEWEVQALYNLVNNNWSKAS